MEMSETKNNTSESSLEEEETVYITRTSKDHDDGVEKLELGLACIPYTNRHAHEIATGPIVMFLAYSDQIEFHPLAETKVSDFWTAVKMHSLAIGGPSIIPFSQKRDVSSHFDWFNTCTEYNKLAVSDTKENIVVVAGLRLIDEQDYCDDVGGKMECHCCPPDASANQREKLQTIARSQIVADQQAFNKYTKLTQDALSVFKSFKGDGFPIGSRYPAQRSGDVSDWVQAYV